MPFTPSLSAALDGPDWLKRSRSRAAQLIETTETPTAEQELWRYSRVGEIDLDGYRPAGEQDGVLGARPPAILESIGSTAATVTLVDGAVITSDISDPAGGLVITSPGEADFDTPVDLFGVLNAAFTSAPIVIANHYTLSGVGYFPRVFVRAGEASQATVIESFTSETTDSLVVSNIQHEVGQAANLDYVNVQLLGDRIHQVGHNLSRVARDAHFSSTTVALGGDYARVRTDSHVEGKGGEARLRAVFFGAGSQMHDFRTLQQHDGPKTTSDLFFKGAVGDRARSVYSGLIRVEKGAAGTNAFQTNRNLVLSDGAQAESVPNLEIEENDVRCSHASATGPIDEEHRYYLESRGVPTDVANRLIAKGFLDEVLDEVGSTGLRRHLTGLIDAKLDSIRQVVPSS